MGEVIPAFDFAAALALDVRRRMERCVDRVRERLVAQGLWDLWDIPPVPESGASPEELGKLESELGIPLPQEYRGFLERWRYLDIDTGLEIWGFDHEGVTIGTPWVSNDHDPNRAYLVFGEYWNYADGDQLMFDLSAPGVPVVVYLHEHGPLYEWFAPTFSLALWRMVYEGHEGEADEG